jgi:hypothetical protein
MIHKETLRLLNHPDVKPFWDDVQRIRDAQYKTMMEEEDVSYIKAVKALDRILGLPAYYENVVDNKNDE